MKLHQDLRADRNTITAYGDDYVDVNYRRHAASLVVLPGRVVADWAGAGFDGLAEDDFRSLAELCAAERIAILLLGTGARQRFPAPALLRPLIEIGLGVEVMDTHAACRTYNILVAEDRSVAAALLIR